MVKKQELFLPFLVPKLELGNQEKISGPGFQPGGKATLVDQGRIYRLEACAAKY